MEKSKTQGFSILLLAALVILANPVSAEDYEEVNVSGVTVYLVMDAESKNFSYYGYYGIINPPSCSVFLTNTY